MPLSPIKIILLLVIAIIIIIIIIIVVRLVINHKKPNVTQPNNITTNNIPNTNTNTDTNTPNTNTNVKKAYFRTGASIPPCLSTAELVGGLCYKKCDSGYTAAGQMCNPI